MRHPKFVGRVIHRKDGAYRLESLRRTQVMSEILYERPGLRPTLQERAYQLAKVSASVAEVRQTLIREGYENVHAHLGAPTLRLALKRLCREGVRARELPVAEGG
jgi:hypothetical protein